MANTKNFTINKYDEVELKLNKTHVLFINRMEDGVVLDVVDNDGNMIWSNYFSDIEILKGKTNAKAI